MHFSIVSYEKALTASCLTLLNSHSAPFLWLSLCAFHRTGNRDLDSHSSWVGRLIGKGACGTNPTRVVLRHARCDVHMHTTPGLELPPNSRKAPGNPGFHRRPDKAGKEHE